MIELLSPAKDVPAAEAAIVCGADAVYIGTPQFSARQAAGNSIEDIARVVTLARPYRVKVYAALNTLLFDEEVPQAEAIIGRLYDIGVDGLIIQDVGLLELDLPPLPLIASTQMHNNTPEKVNFLEQVGFSRVILARELTLEQIADIRRRTSVELECFVHGALCVSQSGRCAMSWAIGGRSGNRGQCAQPCRRPYTLKDADGQTLVKDRYLLSLKDLNLSGRLAALLDAGISSFKIEGRLKDAAYVANTVGYYRQTLDPLLAARNLKKSSCGTVTLHFTPDPQKTFNRGFTEYGLIDKNDPMGSIDTPKSLGQAVGTVRRIDGQSFILDGNVELHNADGLCFFDAQRHLCGTVVNRVDGRRVYPQTMTGLCPGAAIYRNHDPLFIASLLSRPARRTLALTMTLSDTPDGVELKGIDEDGLTAAFDLQLDKQPARQPEAVADRLCQQLKKLGNTLFACPSVSIQTAAVYFLPISTINALKRGLIDRLMQLRSAADGRRQRKIVPNSTPYPAAHLSWQDNVLNQKARAFYRRHGVEHIEAAAESGRSLRGQTVMTTKYCLRRALGLCCPDAAPLILEDEDGRTFRVEFLCETCGMKIDWIGG